MKNTNNSGLKENKQQSEAPAKKKNNKQFSDHSPAIASNATDALKNTASSTDGLNQQKTNDNELEPGIH